MILFERRKSIWIVLDYGGGIYMKKPILLDTDRVGFFPSVEYFDLVLVFS